MAGTRMTFVLSSSDGVDPGRMGGKAAALASLSDTRLKIPAWFVISPAAFEAGLSPFQRGALLRAEGQDELQELFAGLSPVPPVMEEVEARFAALDRDVRLVAVRSSGLEEDGVEHSFAGQFDSYLSVTRKRLPARIVDVWRSGFSERVLAYRRENNLGLPQAPAVLVQEMVDSEVSGVAFSADPVTG
ncbi:MAG: phosphoenolpyruvate synthase, partial [Gammaproteobacteria bacterium]|nr:phosphoenolpyruvate synthase [Gammaproteobacteria bacterium]